MAHSTTLKAHGLELTLTWLRLEISFQGQTDPHLCGNKLLHLAWPGIKGCIYTAGRYDLFQIVAHVKIFGWVLIALTLSI